VLRLGACWQWVKGCNSTSRGAATGRACSSQTGLALNQGASQPAETHLCPLPQYSYRSREVVCRRQLPLVAALPKHIPILGRLLQLIYAQLLYKWAAVALITPPPVTSSRSCNGCAAAAAAKAAEGSERAAAHRWRRLRRCMQQLRHAQPLKRAQAGDCVCSFQRDAGQQRASAQEPGHLCACAKPPTAARRL
jgi:hypothetical protein